MDTIGFKFSYSIKIYDVIKNKAKELLANVTVAPMAGSEIPIVSPTLATHHQPHPACDILATEFGAKQ